MTSREPSDLGFHNTYARLPKAFYARVNPTPVAAPRLIQLNRSLAKFLNLDPDFLASPAGVEILAGNRIAAGSEPLAMAYAGHQFGHFVPSLGDGRANLLGEVIAQDGRRFDLHLKGSGPTPFSRRGDGRAALGPVLREYLVSEAMHALGVPSARALAAVASGEEVFRAPVQPGAVFTRVAASHLRVGSFQFFAAKNDFDSVRLLADYSIARHYPECEQSENRYRAFFTAVVARHAALVANWLNLGFIHGVMNTDNTSISGETIDFGPCAFLEAYNPDKVFSSIDQQGRYAYSNQPAAAHWNLARLAECLLPLIQLEAGSQETALEWAYEALATFIPLHEAAHLAGLRRKLGLVTQQEGDPALAQDLLDRMAAHRADFTLTFRLLGRTAGPDAAQPVRNLFADPSAFDAWCLRWRERLALEPLAPSERAVAMNAANPLVIPRNHLVEAVIEAAVERQDFAPFHSLLEAITQPFTDRPLTDPFTTPATPTQEVRATFCGT